MYEHWQDQLNTACQSDGQQLGIPVQQSVAHDNGLANTNARRPPGGWIWPDAGSSYCSTCLPSPLLPLQPTSDRSYTFNLPQDVNDYVSVPHNRLLERLKHSERRGPIMMSSSLPSDDQPRAVTIASLSDYDNDTDAGSETSHGSRRQRSSSWPPLSDPTPTIRRPISFAHRTIDSTGREAGRNLMAILQDGDNVPRTRYNLTMHRGRPMTYLPNVQRYPPCDTIIPGGLSLQEICQYYPRHVWGSGLRIFIAEGWNGERIFSSLPADFRDSKAQQRPWNYIQQGVTREIKMINQEDGVPAKDTTRKRKTRTERENIVAEVDHDEDNGGQTDAPAPTQAHHGGSAMTPSASLLIDPNLTIASTTAVATNPPTAASQEASPMSDEEVQRVFEETDRILEYHRQEELLLSILEIEAPQHGHETAVDQINRIRQTRRYVCHMNGIDLDNVALEHLRAFTVFLIGQLNRARGFDETQ